MTTTKLNCTTVTPEFTGSYVHVLEPTENQSGVLKYSISMVFDEGENLDELKTAAKNAGINMWGADESKWPKSLRSPFRDGNEKDNPDPLYLNSIFVNANANVDRKPGIVDQALKPVMDPDIIYSGARFRAQVSFFAYDQAGNRGVGCGLNHLMFCRHGERLGGGVNAETAFADFKQEAAANSGLNF